MTNLLNAKKELIEFAEGLNYKYELSKTVSEDYYEPGMMENLDQYMGEYDKDTRMIVLRVESKGLRYENRTYNIEQVNIGDSVEIIRDERNPFNSNNFEIKNKNNSLGYLPAGLCNALAPLYDAGYATIQMSKVSYMEKLKDRSRYAKQGVLFVEINIQLRGI